MDSLTDWAASEALAKAERTPRQLTNRPQAVVLRITPQTVCITVQARQEDDGVYTCQAENIAGKIAGTAHLTLLSKLSPY